MGLITLYNLAGNSGMRCPNKDGNFFKIKTLDFEKLYIHQLHKDNVSQCKRNDGSRLESKKIG